MKKKPYKYAIKITWKGRKVSMYTKLNPISKSKHRRLKRFVPASVIKEIKKRSGGRCEFVFPDGFRCWKEAQKQPHHVLKRSQGGEHTLENLRDTCPFHNIYAELEPKACVKLGWVIPYKGYKNE